MHRLFISDLHLSEATPEIEAALNNLLGRETDLDGLVILGDFLRPGLVTMTTPAWRKESAAFCQNVLPAAANS